MHMGATSTKSRSGPTPVPVEAGRPRDPHGASNAPQQTGAGDSPKPVTGTRRRAKLGIVSGVAVVLVAAAVGGYYYWVSQTRGMPFVVSYEPGRLVSGGYSGWIGMQFNVGAAPIAVTDLGRLSLAGNNRKHTLQLLIASTAQQVPGASVEISMKGSSPGEFVFGALPKPVPLRPGETYMLVSSESVSNNVGDYFYDERSRVDTAAGVRIEHAVYLDGTTWRRLGQENETFGPVNFRYLALPAVIR
jgi:hypothetical protein